MKKKQMLMILSGIACAAVINAPVQAEKQGPRLSGATVFCKGKKTVSYKIKYDKKGRVKSIRVHTPDSDSRGAYLAGTDYSYDKAGRIAKINASNMNPGKTLLTYKDGKLIKIQHPATYVLKKNGKIAEKKIIYSTVTYKGNTATIRGGLINNDNRYTRTYKKGVLASEKIEEGGYSLGTVRYSYNRMGYLAGTSSTVPTYDMKAHKLKFRTVTRYSYTYKKRYGRKVPVAVSTDGKKIRLDYASGKSVRSQQDMLLGRDTGPNGLYSAVAYSRSQLCGVDAGSIGTGKTVKNKK